MTNDELFWLAVYWDDFLDRYGVTLYMEVRYGLGAPNDNPGVRLRDEHPVAR
jgi:hypothetical protein